MSHYQLRQERTFLVMVCLQENSSSTNYDQREKPALYRKTVLQSLSMGYQAELDRVIVRKKDEGA